VSNPLDRLRGVKEKADATDETRRLYQRFVTKAKNIMGWSESDVSEYAASVKTIMTGNDDAVLDLFPAGLYGTAEDARAAAIEYWRTAA
jgi:hypothetical protein